MILAQERNRLAHQGSSGARCRGRGDQALVGVQHAEVFARVHESHHAMRAMAARLGLRRRGFGDRGFGDQGFGQPGYPAAGRAGHEQEVGAREREHAADGMRMIAHRDGYLLSTVFSMTRSWSRYSPVMLVP